VVVDNGEAVGVAGLERAQDSSVTQGNVERSRVSDSSSHAPTLATPPLLVVELRGNHPGDLDKLDQRTGDRAMT
jgi:hypothetical protein